MAARVASALLGVWLMAAPAVLGYTGPLPRAAAHVLGPLAVTFAVVAMAQATEALRWGNVAVAALLLLSVLFDHRAPAALNHALVAGALGVLASVRGPRRERLGGGWRALRSSAPGVGPPIGKSPRSS